MNHNCCNLKEEQIMPNIIYNDAYSTKYYSEYNKNDNFKKVKNLKRKIYTNNKNEINLNKNYKLYPWQEKSVKILSEMEATINMNN